MRVFDFARLGWVLMAVFTLAGCGTDEADDGAYLTLLDEHGAPEKIRLDDTTVVCGLGTWCPYSRQFVEWVKDERIAGQLDEFNILFVFEDETPIIESKAPHLISKMTRINDDIAVLYVGLLSDVPGVHYFLPKDTELEFPSVPTMLTARNTTFSEHPFQWFVAKGHVSKSIALEVWESYGE